MYQVDENVLVKTRTSLHGVAESLIAGPGRSTGHTEQSGWR